MDGEGNSNFLNGGKAIMEGGIILKWGSSNPSGNYNFVFK